MDQTTTNALISYIKKLSDTIVVDKVVVFGSRSWGEPELNSDVDVVVVSQSFSDMSMDERLDLLYQKSALIEPEIHPWGYTADEVNNLHPQSMIGAAISHGTNVPLV